MSKDKFGKTCPACKTPWTHTPRLVPGEVWTHCKPCNKKAETILEEMKSKPKSEQKGKLNPHFKHKEDLSDMELPDDFWADDDWFTYMQDNKGKSEWKL